MRKRLIIGLGAILVILVIITSLAGGTEIAPQVSPGSGGAGRVEMSLEQYQALEQQARESARTPEAAPLPALALESVAYEGKIMESSIRLTATARAYVPEGKWTTLALFPASDGLALEGFSGAVKSLSLSPETGSYVAVFDSAGAHEFSYAFQVPLQAGEGGRVARFPVPRAAASSLILHLGAGRRADVSPSLGAVEEAEPGGARLKVQLAPTDQLTIALSPSASAPYYFTRAAYTIEAGADGAKVAADLEFTVNAEPEGGVLVADRSVALGAVTMDGRPHSVRAGAAGFTLSPTGTGPHRAHIEWFQPVSLDEASRSITIPVTAAPISTMAVSVPGENANIEITPGLDKKTEAAGGRTTTTVSLPVTGKVSVSWSEKPPPSRLLARGEEEKLRMSASALTVAGIEDGLLTVDETVEYRILRGELSEVRFDLPADVEVVSVEGGFVKDWNKESVDAGKRYHVYLDRKVRGGYKLRIVYEKLLKELPLEGMKFPVLAILDVEREKGTMAVRHNPELTIVPAPSDNLRRLEVDRTPELRRLNPLYAFQYIRAPYTLALDLGIAPPPEPEVSAEVSTLATISEGVVSGYCSIAYDISNAGIDSVQVVLPEDVKLTDVQGRMVRGQSSATVGGKNLVTISLERPVLGAWRVMLQYERVMAPDARSVEVPLAEPEGVSSIEGYVGIAAEHGLEISDREAGNLRAIDLSQLKGPMFDLSEAMVLKAYSYSRARGADHPPRLSFNLAAHQEVGVQSAFVDEARCLTLVQDNGFSITKAVLSVRNKDHQNLKITLPPGSELWSAFLADEPVPPVKDNEGRILIPLPKSDLGEDGQHANFPVEVVYKTSLQPMRAMGSRELFLPDTDLAVGKIVWQVYLPMDKTYTSFGGNMGGVVHEKKTPREASNDLRDFAGLLTGNFLKFQAKAKQSEAKQNLGAIFTTQVSYFGEKDTFAGGPDCFKEMGWAPEGNTLYSYFCGSDVIPGTRGRISGSPIGGTSAGKDKFLAVAVGNMDNDSFLDIWAIDDQKRLINLADDVTNTYSPLYQQYKDQGLIKDFGAMASPSIQEQMKQADLRGMLSLKIDVPASGKLFRFEKLFPGAQGEKLSVRARYWPDLVGRTAGLFTRVSDVAVPLALIVLGLVALKKSDRAAFFKKHWVITSAAFIAAALFTLRSWFR